MDALKNENDNVEWVPLIRGVQGTEIDILGGFLDAQGIPHKRVMPKKATPSTLPQNLLLPHRDFLVQRNDYGNARALLADAHKLETWPGGKIKGADDWLYADSSGNTVEIIQTSCPVCDGGKLVFRDKKYGHILWNSFLIYLMASSILVHFIFENDTSSNLLGEKIFGIVIQLFLCAILFRKGKPTCWFCENCGREFFKKVKT